MKRSELEELHYITAIDNIASILRRGILSYRRVREIGHTSIAMDEIQERRAKVVVPGGRPLHEYACLYICGRNVMLYKRRGRHQDICVLRVSPNVLDLPGVVITDANASSDYVRFAAAPGGLQIVDRELTFAERWTDPDPIAYYRKKSAKCAEVLVPEQIGLEHILGCYASCAYAEARIAEIDSELGTTIDAHLFFL